MNPIVRHYSRQPPVRSQRCFPKSLKTISTKVATKLLLQSRNTRRSLPRNALSEWGKIIQSRTPSKIVTPVHHLKNELILVSAHCQLQMRTSTLIIKALCTTPAFFICFRILKSKLSLRNATEAQIVAFLVAAAFLRIKRLGSILTFLTRTLLKEIIVRAPTLLSTLQKPGQSSASFRACSKSLPTLRKQLRGHLHRVSKPLNQRNNANH